MRRFLNLLGVGLLASGILCVSFLFAFAAEDITEGSEKPILSHASATNLQAAIQALERFAAGVPREVPAPKNWAVIVTNSGETSFLYYGIVLRGHIRKMDNDPSSLYYFDSGSKLQYVVSQDSQGHALVTNRLFYRGECPVGRATYTTNGLSEIWFVYDEKEVPLVYCRLIPDKSTLYDGSLYISEIRNPVRYSQIPTNGVRAIPFRK